MRVLEGVSGYPCVDGDAVARAQSIEHEAEELGIVRLVGREQAVERHRVQDANLRGVNAVEIRLVLC